MAYHRWSSEGKNPCPLYIWQGFDGLHVWTPGQDDETGLLFRDGKYQIVVEALMHTLYDHLVGNGKHIKVRKGELDIRKVKKY